MDARRGAGRGIFRLATGLGRHAPAVVAAVLLASGCSGARAAGGGGAPGPHELSASTARCTAVVRGVVRTPGGVVQLPDAPGRIVTRSEAVAAARRRERATAGSAATAKLSSWTEVQAMLRSGARAAAVAGPASSLALPPVPAELRRVPWAPLWAVLLRPGAAGSGARQAQGEVVVVSAATGRPEFAAPADGSASWFTALTDRDPALGGCPGGSTAQVPFGVLTRDEEAYTVRGAKSGAIAAASPGASVSGILKLTTVRALNRADPSMYGGCVRQDCALDQLLWPDIAIVRAKPGKTVACLPGFASYPPGYRPKQVRQYVVVGVPGNYGIFCGKEPGWLVRLPDLAPPAR